MALPNPAQLPWPHLMMCYRIFLGQLEEARRTGQMARVASLRPHVELAEAELSRRGLSGSTQTSAGGRWNGSSCMLPKRVAWHLFSRAWKPDRQRGFQNTYLRA